MKTGYKKKQILKTSRIAGSRKEVQKYEFRNSP